MVYIMNGKNIFFSIISRALYFSVFPLPVLCYNGRQRRLAGMDDRIRTDLRIYANHHPHHRKQEGLWL